MQTKNKPIYIHSLFRSGSTYMFNLFRENEEYYTCYQEPLHEFLLKANLHPSRLLDVHKETSKSLRHSNLKKPYFYEFFPLAERHLISLTKPLCYDTFFKKDNRELKNYINTLIEESPKRAVLQLCRSYGRVEDFKKMQEGTHIFLWRNPWDQWWSYKINNYFNAINLLILNVKELPLFLQEIKTHIALKPYHHNDIFLEIEHFMQYKLSPEESYFIFYALWCYALLGNIPLADISINIDSLTVSQTYQNEIQTELEAHQVDTIDLSDTKSPIGMYSDTDREFFHNIENKVQKILSQYYSDIQIDTLIKTKEIHSPHKNSKYISIDSITRDLAITREMTRRYENELSVAYNHLEDYNIKLSQAEERRVQAEEKTAQAEEKATQTELAYHALLNSTSWKLTKPLRLAAAFTRWFITGAKHWITFSPTSRPRRFVKKMLTLMQTFLQKYPRLKKVVTQLLYRFPRLKNRLLHFQEGQTSIFTIQDQKEALLTRQAYRLYNTLEQICSQPVHNIQNKHRRKMAIVTPIPPDQTGIADYIDDLLPSLSKIYDIEIVTENTNHTYSYPVRDIAYFTQNAHLYGKIIYQIGNSHFHWYMFDLLRQFPGIVILHDFYLGDALYWSQFHKEETPEIWDDALIESHGYSSIYLRDKHGIKWALNKYPANVQVLQDAKAVIVHSRYATQLASTFYGGKYDHKLYRLEQVHQEVLEPSKNTQDEFLVCSFGHIVEHKQIHRIISAWISLGFDKNPKCRLVFVGNLAEDEFGEKIKRSIQTIDNIEITGYISTEAFEEYLKKSSVAIQLRANSKGETSRAVLDCLAYGIPTIINAAGSMKEFDNDTVYRIPETFTEKELSDAMILLYQDQALRNKLSQNAKQLIRHFHRPDIIARKLETLIENIYEENTFTLNDLCPDHQQDNTALLEQAKKYDMLLRAQQVPSLYVDISVVAVNDFKTGIQRVVRSILISLFEVQNNAFNIIPVYLSDENGTWHYRIANHYMNTIVTDFALTKNTLVEPVASDIFLGLDFYAGGVTEAAKSNLFKEWKKRGVSIHFVVYDILPIQFPDFFPASSSDTHKQWLQAIAGISDSLLCISSAVADDVKDYLAKQPNHTLTLPETHYFHLGADIENSIPSKGIPESGIALLKELASTINFTMIGTLEPRKGHMQTLLAFEALWKNNLDVHLIIVGKEGWSVEDLTEKIRQHPERNKRLHWIEGASDEYLTKIYHISTCLIAASEGEGFGLPLIEAAQHHIPILARNIPVFKEVAGKYAYYFDNDNEPSTLAKSIKEWLLLYKANQHPKSDNMPWLTWKESTNELLSQIHKRYQL